VQSQQLLPKGEVLKEEFFSGTKRADEPAEEVPNEPNHPKILTSNRRRGCASKSLILRM
jgi:hypothetical protein